MSEQIRHQQKRKTTMKDKKENKLITFLVALNEALFLCFTATIFGICTLQIFGKWL